MSKHKKTKAGKESAAPKSAKAVGKAPASSPLKDAEAWLELNGKWVLLLGWLFILALYLSLASNELGGVLGGDNCQYLMLARSLAQGKGYHDIFFPGEPFHTKYPILFPLLLAPFARSANQVLYSHLLIQIFASLVPLLLCAWARMEGESRVKSLLIFFLAGTIPAWYSFQLNILTESVFMFFMFLALFILSAGRAQGFDIFRVVLLSLALWASAMIREVGLVLFGAVFIGIILDRRLRRTRVNRVPLIVWVTGIFVVGYASWSARNLAVGGGGFYFKQLLQKDPYLPEQGWMNFSDLLVRIKTNLFLHIPHLGGFATPEWLFKSEASAIWVTGIIFAVIIIGVIDRVREKHYVMEAVFLSLFGVAAVWYFQEQRFSLPILPLAAYYFLKGIDSFSKFFKARTEGTTVFIALFILLWQVPFTCWLCYKYHDTQLYPQSPVMIEGYGEWSKPVIDASKYSEYWQMPNGYWSQVSEAIALQKAAAEILPQDAVIACRKPQLAWYFAQRKATWYKFGAAPAEQWKEFEKNKITHILVSGANRELVDMLKAYPDNFKFIAVIQSSGQGLAEVKYPEQR